MANVADLILISMTLTIALSISICVHAFMSREMYSGFFNFFLYTAPVVLFAGATIWRVADISSGHLFTQSDIAFSWAIALVMFFNYFRLQLRIAEEFFERKKIISDE